MGESIALRGAISVMLACAAVGSAASEPPPPPSASAPPDAAHQTLDPAALRGDLALLDRALRALHPGLTRYQSSDDWAARVSALREAFGQPRSRSEAYLEFSRLVAAMRCGHTYLNHWNQSGDTKAWLFDRPDKLPFEFRLDARDRFVVTRSAAFDPNDRSLLLVGQGETIETVQGVETAQLVQRLLPLVRADGANDGKRRSLIEIRGDKDYETSDALIPLLVPPSAAGWTLRVRGTGGAGVREVIVPAVTATRRHRTARPIVTKQPLWALSREGELALLRVDGFADEDAASGGKWHQFLVRSFAELRRDRVRGLIVDLRANEGGSDAAAAELVSFLISERIKLPPVESFVVYQTVPADLRPYLSTWDESFYDRRSTTTPVGDGRFRRRRAATEWTDIRPAAAHFAGPLAMLISPVNSSATHNVARLLSGRPQTSLIGAPTGGDRRASTGGNIFFMRLPGTGFEVDIPLIAYEWPSEQPGPVRPDIECTEGEALDRARAELARVIPGPR